ncbi:hypothetical protein D3C71_1459160 [compost metagenome]
MALVEARGDRAAHEMNGHLRALLVDIFGDFGGCAVEQGQLQIGKALGDFADQRVHGRVGQGFIERQRELGLAAGAQRQRALVQRLRLAQQFARLQQQQLAGIRELRIAPRTVEQFDVEVGFEHADRGADGRLRPAQAARGLAEGAAVGSQNKLAKLLQSPLHGLDLSIS